MQRHILAWPSHDQLHSPTSHDLVIWYQTLRDYTLHGTDVWWVSCPDFRRLLWAAQSGAELSNAVKCQAWRWASTSEWVEAVDGQLVDSAAISNSIYLKQQLFREFKITYQTSKRNNHLVPILFRCTYGKAWWHWMAKVFAALPAFIRTLCMLFLIQSIRLIMSVAGIVSTSPQ